ncbi:MAG: response regulator [Zetaproteobacteria bacterium]|nr:response regulator [Pseudobdellovibrionaceae bacterium]|tara:strand:- start:1668 stop:2048 length:381 start_codon:yes stop_codon:yes gene_type:complete
MGKILYIDDSPLMLDLVSATLTEAGHNIITAPHAEKALEIMDQEKNIELVISDQNMPGMDGISLVQRIREKPENAGIIITMLTSDTNTELSAQAKKAGVQGIISKPIDKTNLVKVVNMLLKTKKVS